MSVKRETIGVAGYSGSGKSTFARYLSEKNNALLIDVDSLAKTVMCKNSDMRLKLRKNFGEDIIHDSEIDFKSLGKKVFNNIENLALLNNIVHPALIEELKNIIGNNKTNGLIIDAALIPFWKMEEYFDKLYWIKADFEIRIKRVLKRVKFLNEIEIRKRFKLQEGLFQEPQLGWHIIHNNDTVEGLILQYESQEGS